MTHTNIIVQFLPIVQIPRNPEVKVRISSGVAHTKEGKREILTMLRGGGDLSRKTLLENYDIDPEEEEARLEEEKLEGLKVQMALEGGQPPLEGSEGLVGAPEEVPLDPEIPM